MISLFPLSLIAPSSLDRRRSRRRQPLQIAHIISVFERPFLPRDLPGLRYGRDGCAGSIDRIGRGCRRRRRRRAKPGRRICRAPGCVSFNPRCHHWRSRDRGAAWPILALPGERRPHNSWPRLVRPSCFCVALWLALIRLGRLHGPLFVRLQVRRARRRRVRFDVGIRNLAEAISQDADKHIFMRIAWNSALACDAKSSIYRRIHNGLRIARLFFERLYDRSLERFQKLENFLVWRRRPSCRSLS